MSDTGEILKRVGQPSKNINARELDLWDPASASASASASAAIDVASGGAGAGGLKDHTDVSKRAKKRKLDMEPDLSSFRNKDIF